jgi:hypothetical protein
MTAETKMSVQNTCLANFSNGSGIFILYQKRQTKKRESKYKNFRSKSHQILIDDQITAI